jgi:hypothetical protein
MTVYVLLGMDLDDKEGIEAVYESYADAIAAMKRLNDKYKTYEFRVARYEVEPASFV